MSIRNIVHIGVVINYILYWLYINKGIKFILKYFFKHIYLFLYCCVAKVLLIVDNTFSTRQIYCSQAIVTNLFYCLRKALLKVKCPNSLIYQDSPLLIVLLITQYERRCEDTITNHYVLVCLGTCLRFQIIKPRPQTHLKPIYQKLRS